MITKRAVYENGKISFADQRLPRGKMSVLVTFLEDEEPVDDKVAKRRAFAEKWAGAFAVPGVDVDSLRQQRLDELGEKHA